MTRFFHAGLLIKWVKTPLRFSIGDTIEVHGRIHVVTVIELRVVNGLFSDTLYQDVTLGGLVCRDRL